MLTMIRSGFLALLLVMAAPGNVHPQPQDAATKFRHALAFEQAGDGARAALLYRELLEKEPSNIVYLDALQRVLMQLKRYDEVVDLLQRRLAAQPRDIATQSMLGNVYYKADREADARQAWSKAVAIDPGNPQTYRFVASVLVENRLLDNAADLYRRGREACKNPGLFTIELAQLLAMTMDYRGATEEYVAWLRQNPTQLSFVQNRMGAFTWAADGRKAAIDAVHAAVDDKEDSRLYELLGWLYIEGKDFSSALEAYRTLDKLSRAQGAALYGFADRTFKERAFDVAARAYQEAIAVPLTPARLPYAHYGYANALKELGAMTDTLGTPLVPALRPPNESRQRFAGPVAYYRKIIDDYPNSEFSAKSYYQIGTIQFEKFFDLDGALDSFDHAGKEIAGMDILRYDVALKRGALYLAKGDTGQAAANFRAVSNAPNALPDQLDEATFRLAQVEYFSGKFTEATERLSTLTVNLKADYANDALELQAFLEENVSSAPAALARCVTADFLAQQRKYNDAIAVLQDLPGRYPGAPLIDDVLLRMSTLFAASGRYPEAIAACERLLTEFKETSTLADRAQFQVGEVYEFGLHDASRAITAYEKLLANYPKSVMGNLARQRIRHLRGEA
jgi:tetratricopeptide (TPR) repeat protein